MVAFTYYLNDVTPFDNETITVVYDSNTYVLNKYTIDGLNAHFYGATTEDGLNFNFEEYQFCIAVDEYDVALLVPEYDTDSHTIEAYADETVIFDPVWALFGTGGSPTPRGELLFEGTFTEWEYVQESDYYYSSSSMEYENITGTVSIEWNGTLYENLELTEDGYGAPWDNNLDAFDFSEYPFNVYTLDSVSTVYVSAPRDDEVTLKIYGTLPEPTLVTAYEGTFTASHTGTGAHEGQYYAVAERSEYNAEYLLGERTCNITFDGNEYELSNESDDVDWYGEYGDITLTETPFFAFCDSDHGSFRIYVVDQNQHTMKITTLYYE